MDGHTCILVYLSDVMCTLNTEFTTSILGKIAHVSVHVRAP